MALDATPLTLSSGGLKRYVWELSRALAENYPDSEFFLMSDQAFRAPQPGRRNLQCGALPRTIFERRWWLWGLDREMRQLNCEIFHGTNFEVPYLPLRPSVMTVHDLSPWMNPEWHGDAGRVRRRTPVALGMGLGTMAITPTEAVRRQVIERFRVSAGRVIAVPHGASEVFRPVEGPQAAPYFLYVGALEPRKNLAAVVDAWRSVRARHDVDLVLVGRRREDFPEFSPEPGLHVPGEVEDADLAKLYSGALAFVYPSHYEGFGLPVLEAMQCGACVLISNDAALREVAGDAGVALDGAAAWAEAMGAAAENPAWVEEHRRKSLARAHQFSWKNTARQTWEVYEEAGRRFGD